MTNSVLVVDRERAVVVCECCEIAETPCRRLRGLMGRRRLSPAEGLMLRPVSSIHTCFMRFEIDAVFLDRGMRVVAIRERMRPWRVASATGAHAVLELPRGMARARGLEAGQRLRLAANRAALPLRSSRSCRYRLGD